MLIGRWQQMYRVKKLIQRIVQVAVVIGVTAVVVLALIAHPRSFSGLTDDIYTVVSFGLGLLMGGLAARLIPSPRKTEILEELAKEDC